MLKQTSEVRFSPGVDGPEVEDYQPVSRLAISAFLVAIVSFVALIHPLLWFVPAVAVLLAVAALASFARPEARYSGKWLTIAALCLALLVAGYAPARALSRQQRIYAQAEEFNRAWIELVIQGRAQEAHQLSLPPIGRFQGPESLTDYYAGKTASSHAAPEVHEMESTMPGNVLAEFLKNPSLTKLLKIPMNANIRRVQNESLQDAEGGVIVRQRFAADFEQQGQPQSIEFIVQSRRLSLQEGKADWQLGEQIEEVAALQGS